MNEALGGRDVLCDVRVVVRARTELTAAAEPPTLRAAATSFDRPVLSWGEGIWTWSVVPPMSPKSESPQHRAVPSSRIAHCANGPPATARTPFDRPLTGTAASLMLGMKLPMGRRFHSG
jgi:hypothetical protein